MTHKPKPIIGTSAAVLMLSLHVGLGCGESDEPLLSALGAFLVGRPTFPPLVHSQVSIIKDRKPAWCFRPGEVGRSLLLVA